MPKKPIQTRPDIVGSTDFGNTLLFQGRQFNNFCNSDDKQGTNRMVAALPRFAPSSFVALVATAARADLLTHRDLSYFIAKTIAETVIESCTATGYRVSAVAVDRAGETIVALHGDNAGPHTMENARRKAYTALSFRTSTVDYAKRFATDDPIVREQVTLPNVIAIPGGLPIKVGDDVIGAVGVSGSPGADESCVHLGLDKVVGQLK
jgi:uncharacterized protein GlcG (DUF336 family)